MFLTTSTQVLFYGLFTSLFILTILALLSIAYISILKTQLNNFTYQIKQIEKTIVNFSSKRYGILLNDFE